MDAEQLFNLEPHGADTFVGTGPKYPWGGLYGGQIVAQALRAAAATVDVAHDVHSLRAYFIRPGDHAEPIRFEVDRIRNGKSFATRRVVARQAIGAILNLEASFQRPEASPDISTVAMPAVPSAAGLVTSTWTAAYDRRWLPTEALAPDGRTGSGRTAAWMRVNAELADDELLHRCWLAFLSDDLPSDTVRRARAASSLTSQADDDVYSASLDHTIWFHRPVRVDEWHLYDFACHGFAGGRGLAIGHVFRVDGVHAATVAQEVLMRPLRDGETDQSAH